jgi:hypothetical protein
MKNLGRVIDQLIKVEPCFEQALSQIKTKWKRFPSKEMNYWREMIDYLNSMKGHPKLPEIKDIITSKRKDPKRAYSFEEVTPQDNVLGVIPENIADIIRRHDRQSIVIAKMHVEATMTRDTELLAVVARKEMVQEMSLKKLWIALKDHFKIWNKQNNYTIKKKEGFLVLTEINPQVPPQFIGPGLVKMDADTLKQFMRFLGMNLPNIED